jgi:hypothetical protein
MVWTTKQIIRLLTRRWALQTKTTALDLQEKFVPVLKNNGITVSVYKKTYKSCTAIAVKYYRPIPLQITYYKEAMFVCDVHTNARQLNVNVGIKFKWAGYNKPEIVYLENNHLTF